MPTFIAVCHGEQTWRGRLVSQTPQVTLPRSLMLWTAQLYDGSLHARPTITLAARNTGAASSRP
jgi:hypothetical protein